MASYSCWGIRNIKEDCSFQIADSANALKSAIKNLKPRISSLAFVPEPLAQVLIARVAQDGDDDCVLTFLQVLHHLQAADDGGPCGDSYQQALFPGQPLHHLV